MYTVSEDFVWDLIHDSNHVELLERLKKCIEAFRELGIKIVPSKDYTEEEEEEPPITPEDLPKDEKAKAQTSEMFG